MKTLDGHEDKIWGLHSNKKDDMVVTASSDSCITLWQVQHGGLLPPWGSNWGNWRTQGLGALFFMCSPWLHVEIGSARLLLGFGGIFWPTPEQQMSLSTGALEGSWKLLDLTFKLVDAEILLQKLVSTSLDG